MITYNYKLHACNIAMINARNDAERSAANESNTEYEYEYEGDIDRGDLRDDGRSGGYGESYSDRNA